MTQSSPLKQRKKVWKDTTMGWFRNEYKIDVGVSPNMKISTYLRKTGLPSLARAFDRVSKNS